VPSVNEEQRRETRRESWNRSDVVNSGVVLVLIRAGSLPVVITKPASAAGQGAYPEVLPVEA